MPLIVIIIVVLLSLSSCYSPKNQPKGLNITRYRLMASNPDDPITIVTLLHAYQAQKLIKGKVPSVNLYVCKRSDSKDSMFVFDLNNPPGKAFFDRGFERQGFIINQRNIKRLQTDSVIVYVPYGFVIPKSIDYVFGRIDQTSD